MYLLKPNFAAKIEPEHGQIFKRSNRISWDPRTERRFGFLKKSNSIANVWDNVTQKDGGKSADLSDFGNDWSL